MDKNDFLLQRKILIEEHIEPKISNPKILEAFLKTPRDIFVPKSEKDNAYLDKALAIGEGQTISQPSLVARMTELLDLGGDEKVLEVGTGSGYQAAILSHLAKEVYTVEIIESLYKKTKELLEKLGYKNIHPFLSDGSMGLPEYSPYDAIIVTAGATFIPQPLIDQLKKGGRMVVPVGEFDQRIILGIKKDGRLETKEKGFVHFVPLMGKYKEKEA